METVNIAAKFAQIDEHWRPKVAARLNGQEVKLVKVQGTFLWHHHDDADELFLVHRGRLRVEFRNQIRELEAGEFLVVPRGVEHRTAAEAEAEVMIFVAAGVVNTGNMRDAALTAPDGVTI